MKAWIIVVTAALVPPWELILALYYWINGATIVKQEK